jgi:LDH2 family malate/lactate/ureidoglycolate dehydrogenase
VELPHGKGAPLDEDRPDTVRLSVAEAIALGEQALTRVGYGGDDARIIVDQLVDNALCGYKFAGLPRILAIAGHQRTRGPRTPVRIVHETPVSALLDGGNNVGYIAAYRAAEVAIAKARADSRQRTSQRS